MEFNIGTGFFLDRLRYFRFLFTTMQYVYAVYYFGFVVFIIKLLFLCSVV